ncbi:MAG TPA: PEP/pyruvate-binding domain-containing protein, partial [Longimicrobiaceae bacterium]|nr:PEP/pyruvate-binding domain-containing protein [Longimicrobiaceae bacterium]
MSEQWIRWFDELSLDDVPLVGGKNASLEEMRRALTPLGVRVPDGFATTSEAFRVFLRKGGLDGVVEHALRGLDVTDLDALQRAGRRVRTAILGTELPRTLEDGVRDAYHRLEAEYGPHC